MAMQGALRVPLGGAGVRRAARAVGRARDGAGLRGPIAKSGLRQELAHPRLDKIALPLARNPAEIRTTTLARKYAGFHFNAEAKTDA